VDGKSHMLTGAAAGAACGALHPSAPWLALPAAAVSCVASALPDLDHPRSIASRAIPVVSPLASAAVRVACLGKHRTLTHWLPLWAAIAYLLGAYVAPAGHAHALVMAGCVGYILHLLEDGMTPDGIPLVAPWGHWHVLPWPLRVRGGATQAVASLLVESTRAQGITWIKTYIAYSLYAPVTAAAIQVIDKLVFSFTSQAAFAQPIERGVLGVIGIGVLLGVPRLCSMIVGGGHSLGEATRSLRATVRVGRFLLPI